MNQTQTHLGDSNGIFRVKRVSEDRDVLINYYSKVESRRRTVGTYTYCYYYYYYLENT